uniref:Uncharacterized protein n=1 Tax=Oryza punctata TaxID=4537 RepID=A0A0E0KPK6_ORYPU
MSALQWLFVNDIDVGVPGSSRCPTEVAAARMMTTSAAQHAAQRAPAHIGVLVVANFRPMWSQMRFVTANFRPMWSQMRFVTYVVRVFKALWQM